jgi:PPE-repeat protein
MAASFVSPNLLSDSEIKELREKANKWDSHSAQTRKNQASYYRRKKQKGGESVEKVTTTTTEPENEISTPPNSPENVEKSSDKSKSKRGEKRTKEISEDNDSKYKQKIRRLKDQKRTYKKIKLHLEKMGQQLLQHNMHMAELSKNVHNEIVQKGTRGENNTETASSNREGYDNFIPKATNEQSTFNADNFHDAVFANFKKGFLGQT